MMKPQDKGGLLVFLAVVILTNVNGIPEGDVSAGSDLSRNKKHFSLFSVVTFKNEECSSESTFTGGVVQGTCYTATECTDKKGTKSGNCASGFGVCCIFISATSASATISENRTYIRNKLFPATDTEGAGTTIEYTISKMQSDVCQLRLDFQTFIIAGPANTDENIADGPTTLGTHCNDQFSVTLTSNFKVPILCGVMTGEHLYMDMGPDSTDNAVIAIKQASTTVAAGTAGILAADATRIWSFKTSQIPCWAPYRAPDGCHRYFTQHTGQIISPNFAREPTPLAANLGANKLNAGNDLAGQFLKTCLRREKGMCCTMFQVCNSFEGTDLGEATQAGGAAAQQTLNVVSEGWSFHQSLAGTLYVGEAARVALTNDFGPVDASCTVDYVEIPDSTTYSRNMGAAGQINTRYCGVRFGNIPPDSTTGMMDHAPVYDCTEPWEVNYVTDHVNDQGNDAAANDQTSPMSRGFCLEFFQEAC